MKKDNTGDKPKLRYVFDYADTIDGRYNAKKPFVWELRSEHKEIVLDALNKNYELDDISTDDFGDIIYGEVFFSHLFNDDRLIPVSNAKSFGAIFSGLNILFTILSFILGLKNTDNKISPNRVRHPHR